MSDDHTTDPRATVTLVYKLIGELRSELNDRIDDLDGKLDARFDALLAAIESLRDGVVPEALCVSRHAETEAAIASAVKASESDRQKLWDAIHAVETQLKWAAGIVITAFLGLMTFLFQQHIS